jgi:NADH-quinone oxidoreductase subunit L
VVIHSVGKAIGFPGGISEFVFLEEPERYHINWGLAATSVGISVFGIFSAAWMYWGGRLDRSTRLAQFQPGIYDMLKNKFYFDELYQYLIDRVLLGFSFVVAWFDRYVVNDTGVDGSAQITGYTGSLLKYLQTGKVPNYAMAIAIGVVSLALLGLALRA